MENNYPYLTLEMFPDFNIDRTKVVIYYKINNIVTGWEHVVDNDKLHEFIPNLLKQTENFRIKNI